jgi:hypothetical protein
MPYICQLCGAHFPQTERPSVCPICEDVRGLGFTPRGGARITTLEELQHSYSLELREEEPGLTGIGMTPSFSAGQRALIVQTSLGNVLWDCLALIDDESVAAVQKLGGLAAIALSHPHFYGAMAEWSRAFGGVPTYVHVADRRWVTCPDPAIVYWDGQTQTLPGGITLIHCGGHFDGAAVLHWPAGAEGRGALLTGDPMSVTPDRHVTFMYAYPNLIPLNALAVRRIAESIAPFQYDRIHGGWFGRRVPRDAKAVVQRSVARYLAAIQ